MNVQNGKFKAHVIVRDKNGKIKVDDWNSLSPEFKEIIRKEEDKDGRNARNSSTEWDS